MIFRSEDDSGEESLPELVSANESDTSSSESESESEIEPQMPALVDENASDSSESGIDEVCFSLGSSAIVVCGKVLCIVNFI